MFTSSLVAIKPCLVDVSTDYGCQLSLLVHPLVNPLAPQQRSRAVVARPGCYIVTSCSRAAAELLRSYVVLIK